jgi:sulfate transport system ATP-binding protein
MSFIGQVNRLGEDFVRPHDVTVQLEPNGHTQRAVVERLVHLGFEVRTDLVLEDGRRLSVQLTRQQAGDLALEAGHDVYVTLDGVKQFESDVSESP